MSPLFPNVHVELSGSDGNAFSVLGNVAKNAKKAGVPKEKIDQFMAEATGGNYDHLLSTCQKWFDVS